MKNILLIKFRRGDNRYIALLTYLALRAAWFSHLMFWKTTSDLVAIEVHFTDDHGTDVTRMSERTAIRDTAVALGSFNCSWSTGNVKV